MKYIDADKLIAEINNRLMSVNLEELGNFGCHRVWAYNDVKDLITSLQQEQPEVELEKALDEYYKNADFGPSEAIEYEIHKDIACHFYKLGLNARKED